MNPDAPLDVLIVGAGFSGLAMAIRCRRAGIDRFLVVEKAEDVGGTWHANTYPGAGSDIPSHLYSLSFAPKSDWSRLFPLQGEIKAYLRGLVERYGLRPHLRLNAAVRAAAWDEGAGTWRVETDAGRFRARALVSGVGGLHHPALPDLPGLDRFAGPVFHSARWDHACDLRGRHVGVVGTGASAVQFVPEIAGAVGRLTLFQRSAPYVLPKLDRVIGPRERALYRYLPLARRLFRQRLFWERELPALLGFTKVSRVTEAGEALARRHLRRAVADPELRAKLTPDYRLGCKRVLISDDYYPALTRPNVALVTEPIAELRSRSVVTRDGAEHPVDVLILGTGFDVAANLRGIDLVGRGGLRLSEAWRERPGAFRGITVSGFPNFFLLLGPNTGLGHNSVVAMIEAQVGHVLGALRYLRRHPGAALDVRPEAQGRFLRAVEARTRDSIWTRGGCRSWYLDGAGRNVALWPGSVPAYWRGTRRLRLADYETAPQNRAGSSAKVGGTA